MAIDPGSLLTGLATLGKTASELFSAKSTNERQTLFAEFQKGMAQANADTLAQIQTSLALLERNRELEQQIVNFKNWEAESKRYRLVDPGARGVVYALKESMKNGDPPHYLCTTCYHAGKKSLLGTTVVNNLHHPFLTCPVCETAVELNGRGQHLFAYAPE